MDLLKNKLKNNEKGGLSDDMSVEDIAKKHGISVKDIKKQIEKGVKVELEHTDDKTLSKEIAMDHLVENPNYYDKLEKMEKQNAKEMPKVFYCKHIQAGVAKYDDEMILIENEALKKMMPTMDGIPVYVDHQNVAVENIQSDAEGYVAECFYNKNDGWFWAKFIVVSDDAQESVRKGWSVSNAYLPTQTGEGGVWHNVDYDREILDGEYSHLAIVPHPRYEGAGIFSCDQYKKYNEELKNQIKELTNSKVENKYSIVGGVKMKLFGIKKEEIKNSDDVVVELEDGKTMKLSEMVNAVKKNEEEKEEEKEQKCNDDDKIEVGDEMMSVKELKNKYMAAMKNKAKKNAEDEDEKKNQEDEKEKEENKKNAEDEKKKDEEKKNSKHFKEMKNSIKEGHKEVVAEYDTQEDKLKRGQERF